MQMVEEDGHQTDRQVAATHPASLALRLVSKLVVASMLPQPSHAVPVRMPRLACLRGSVATASS